MSTATSTELPWATADNPCWSGPTPKAVALVGGTYGTLIATRVPGFSDWLLCHDPKEVYWVATLFRRREPPTTFEVDGRRFKVVRG